MILFYSLDGNQRQDTQTRASAHLDADTRKRASSDASSLVPMNRSKQPPKMPFTVVA
jgi:hypothetical protein